MHNFEYNEKHLMKVIQAAEKFCKCITKTKEQK